MPWRLVFKNLTKHWFRSLLTIGALGIALFLLCTLRTLVVALDAGVRDAAANRLIVQSQVSLFVSLPKSYQAKIQEVSGVHQVSRWQWFGGHYKDPQSGFFAQFGTDVDVFLEMYPEIEVIEGSAERFKTERQACLIGTDLVDRFKWKVGDRVPIITGLFARSDREPWTFDVVGIYRSSKKNVDNQTMYFNFEYLAKALETGETVGPDGVGVYVATLQPGADRTQVAATIDGLFENGPQRTLTNTEAEFQAQFVSMMGNIPFFVSAIGMGVLIAILFATLNTMLMASGEQTRDVGVLKALGFTDGSVFALMLTQSIVLCSIGGFGGIGLAIVTEPLVLSKLSTMFPGYELTTETLALGTALTLGLGLLAGILPALRARRLEVVEALRATA